MRSRGPSPVTWYAMFTPSDVFVYWTGGATNAALGGTGCASAPVSRSQRWASTVASTSAKRRAGLDAELLHQPVTKVGPCSQRLGLPPAAGQGEHPLTPQALPERVDGHERVELGNHLLMAPTSQVRVDPVLYGCQPGVGESRGCHFEPERQLDVRQRLASPQPERLMEHLGCRGCVGALEPRSRTFAEGREDLLVDILRLDGKLVTGRNELECVPRLGLVEQLSKCRDSYLQCPTARRRRAIGPQFVEQSIDAHGAARAQGQQGEKSPFLGRGRSHVNPIR